MRGPPGTGKTFTACEVVRGWSEQGLKTLVVAYTNQACQHLAQQLSKLGISAVRLRGSMGAQELLSQESFCNLIGPEKVGEMRESSKWGPYIKLAAERASVVVSSCIASGHPTMLRNFKFSRVYGRDAIHVCCFLSGFAACFICKRW